MKDDEMVAKHYLSTPTHTKFAFGIREKAPNFNILVYEQDDQSE